MNVKPYILPLIDFFILAIIIFLFITAINFYIRLNDLDTRLFELENHLIKIYEYDTLK